MNRVARAVAVWVLIALAETAHGIARTLWLLPAVGDLPARQIGVLTGSLIVLAIAWLTVDWIGATARLALLRIGALWVALMLAFEIALGRYLGASWARLAADYDPAQGGLLGFGMAVLLLAPLVASRWRARARAARLR